MAKKPLPPADVLRQLLDYDPATGGLTWRHRPLEMFEDVNGRTALNCWSVWNAKYAGKAAGQRRAYVIVKLLGEAYLAHRLIWKMQTGDEPAEIDHLNRNKSDNRWANLRDVDHAANMRNKSATKLNTSGHKHIHWCNSNKWWVVQLVVPGKGQRQVAWKHDLAAAIEARNQIMIDLGYNPATDIR